MSVVILWFHTRTNSFPLSLILNTLPPSFLCSYSPCNSYGFSSSLLSPHHQKVDTCGGRSPRMQWISPLEEKKSKTEFRRRNKSKRTQLYPEQHAEQRSCPEVVVLKVTLRGEKEQGVLKWADQDGGGRGCQGDMARGKWAAEPAAAGWMFSNMMFFFLSVWSLRLFSLIFPDFQTTSFFKKKCWY